MAWFRNTISKLVWEVEGDMVDRLRNDPEHEEVRGPRGGVVKAPASEKKEPEASPAEDPAENHNEGQQELEKNTNEPEPKLAKGEEK